MSSYRSHSDIQLVALLQNGDEKAFREIYSRYWDRLFVVACHRLDDQQEAEEVVQNVFVSLWKRRQQLALTYTLGTYMSVAVKYQVITRLAQRRKRRSLLSMEVPAITQTAESVTAWLSEKELISQIEASILALPPKCRIVFELSRKEGVSNARIAETLNISEKTVEGHITKALHFLKGSLGISLPALLLLLKK